MMRTSKSADRWRMYAPVAVVLLAPRAAMATATLLARQSEGVYEVRREHMVREQIEARGIKDKTVLAAFRKVPRHRFVPERLAAPRLTTDGPLPIGEGQTISQPEIVAMMTELIKPDKKMRVLEIGTGSGYQAAILAECVKRSTRSKWCRPSARRPRRCFASSAIAMSRSGSETATRAGPSERPMTRSS